MNSKKVKFWLNYNLTDLTTVYSCICANIQVVILNPDNNLFIVNFYFYYESNARRKVVKAGSKSNSKKEMVERFFVNINQRHNTV